MTQTNSATAQESAAASQELSGQSQLLKDLVARFNLRKDSAAEAASASQTVSLNRTDRRQAAESKYDMVQPKKRQREVYVKQYEWNSSLETGNEMIDSQHKVLIERINELLRACTEGKGRAEIDSTVKFLEDYTKEHFDDEEKLQRKYGYPDRTNHKKYHEGFKKVVRELRKQLEEEGPTVRMVGKINTGIGGRLVNHIQKEDVKVAKHIADSK